MCRDRRDPKSGLDRTPPQIPHNAAIEATRIRHAMKIGDRVEVLSVPGSLPSGMGTQELFAACVGRVFPIEGIEDNGLLELHVGKVVGEESYMHSIWIEADHVLLRAKADDGSAD
jgi:hypothetical protein